MNTPPNYTTRHGDFGKIEVFVINKNLIIIPTNGSLVYLKRTQKPFYIPKDNSGMFYSKGNFRDNFKPHFLSELVDNKNDYYLRVDLSENLDKNASLFFYDDYYCFKYKKTKMPYSKIIYEFQKSKLFQNNNFYYFKLPKSNVPIFEIRTKLDSKINDPNIIWEIKYKVIHAFQKKIKADKAIILEVPNGKVKGYLLKNDLIIILDESNSFYLVQYIKDEKIIGWIRKSDVV